MANLRLRYAGVSYFDKTRPLERGELQPEGVELEYVQFDRVGVSSASWRRSPRRSTQRRCRCPP